ncbi:ubiquitin-like protein [Venturia nashicola]|uniref:Ubiquitin-like protein n=1 Tax=Venturia nashicola TaxID=86259 RepID=A0A4Z1NZ76_9PEZI|nr:ubiquitin-like protein [Venturia nashicola]
MDEPQESMERAASATVEPELHLPNATTENTGDATPSAPIDNLTSPSQQEPHPFPPNPFLQQPPTGTEQHAAPPTRTMNTAPPPTRTMDTTPPPTANPNAVAVTVRDSHGGEVTFKIKKRTKLNRLMYVFCERQGKTPAQVRFFFDGTRITGDDTPESLRWLKADIEL